MAGFTNRIRTADCTETYVVVRVRRPVPVTVRRTAVPGVVVPTAATFHTVRAPCASLSYYTSSRACFASLHRQP